jgi:hypothetical protein
VTGRLPRAAHGRRLARLPVVAGVVLAGLLATGCATIPDSGVVQSTPTPAPPGGGITSAGLVVEGPEAGWSPVQVVSGFLQASASFAHNHAVAREYLTAGASKRWQPGAQVTILAQSPNVQRQLGQLSRQTGHTNVVVSWQKIATLEGSGQYIPVGGGAAEQQVFGLESVGGQWRIDSLPTVGGQKVSTELLLPSVLFHLVYAPRDLYFYTQQPHQLLVPDPVFVPIESTDVVSYVLNGLKQNPNGWLENAAFTAFPPGAQLRKVQVLPGVPGGKTAIVDIGLPPHTPRSVVQDLAAQIVWTLTSSSYSPALLQAVKIKVNGHVWAPGQGDAVQGLTDYARYVPRVPKDPNLYYLGSDGAVRMFGGLAHSVPVPGEAGTGRVPLTQVAVSPDGRYLAGVAGPADAVYTGDLAAAARVHASGEDRNLHLRLTGTGFTGLSFDNSDSLWIAGRVHHTPGVWVIPPVGAPVQVALPAGLGPVTGLKVAPDGVRIALIVGQGYGRRVVLGAVERTGTAVFVPQVVPLAPGLFEPSALTWYDQDHLLAITQPGAASQLWEVPVNGDAPVGKNSLPGMVSIAAAGAQNPLYLGMSAGRLENSVLLGEPWRDIAAGWDATYPG